MGSAKGTIEGTLLQPRSQELERVESDYVDKVWLLRIVSQLLYIEMIEKLTREAKINIKRSSMNGALGRICRDESKIVIAKTKKRKRELGKDSTVKLFGSEIPKKRLKKTEQNFTLSELSSMPECKCKMSNGDVY